MSVESDPSQEPLFKFDPTTGNLTEVAGEVVNIPAPSVERPPQKSPSPTRTETPWYLKTNRRVGEGGIDRSQPRGDRD